METPENSPWSAVDIPTELVSGYDGLTREQMTWMQKLADRTHGIATLPMVATLGGGALCMDGIVEIAGHHNLVQGAAEFAAGRGLDLVDGKIARLFKVWNVVGANADIMVDKIVAFTAIIALWNGGVIPEEAAIPKLVTQSAITLIGAEALRRKIVLKAESNGKVNMFLTSAGIGSFAINYAMSNIDNPVASYIAQTAEYAGYGFTAGSIIVAGMAIKDYAHPILQNMKNNDFNPDVPSTTESSN